MPWSERSFGEYCSAEASYKSHQGHSYSCGGTEDALDRESSFCGFKSHQEYQTCLILDFRFWILDWAEDNLESKIQNLKSIGTGGGSDRRPRPISVLLAGLSPARCTKLLGVAQWERVSMPPARCANGELKVVGTLREGIAYNPYHSDHFISQIISGRWQSGYAAAF